MLPSSRRCNGIVINRMETLVFFSMKKLSSWFPYYCEHAYLFMDFGAIFHLLKVLVKNLHGVDFSFMQTREMLVHNTSLVYLA